MRLDDENGITPRGWITIAFCVIIFASVVVGVVITLLVKLWEYLVTI